MKIGVGIATVGRAEEVGQLLAALRGQTRQPHRIVVSATREEDLGAARTAAGVEVVLGAAGLCKQRNRILESLLTDSDVVAFFDDDYLPSRFGVEGIAATFGEYPSVVGVTGHLLADGIHNCGVSLAEAEALLSAHDEKDRPAGIVVEERTRGLYGCNMAYRTSAIGSLRFDEQLPLYGWQEDIDFSANLKRTTGGRLVRSHALVGVHRGVKHGRSPGVKLGYSQIANPVYLVRKGTMTLNDAARLAVKNVVANHLNLLKPEPWIDRRGRAMGNWLALADLARARLEPGRILGL